MILTRVETLAIQTTIAIMVCATITGNVLKPRPASPLTLRFDLSLVANLDHGYRPVEMTGI